MHHFYHPELSENIFPLSPEESEHCIRALRHRVDDEIMITDGKGSLAKAKVVVDNPKSCLVELIDVKNDVNTRKRNFHLAVAPTKNIDRIEWLVEKSVELGVDAISFIICEHSDRPRVNMQRMERIAVSALKQSQTTILPTLEILPFNDFIEHHKNDDADFYIAWCDDQNERQFVKEKFQHQNIILLIGPEGDFSPAEIETARLNRYVEVKLGNRRLRTETAGLYGCLAVEICG